MIRQHSSNFWILSLGEFWERLSFFGTLILLVLYTHKELHLTDALSFSIYGVFISLSFALPLFGGVIADKYLGYRNAMLCGLLLLITGNLLLTNSHLWSFFLGLALINVGTGLYKPTCTAVVGRLYRETTIQREQAYSIFYVLMNVGATLGPLIYAAVVEIWGWHTGFMVSAIGLTAVTFVFIMFFDQTKVIGSINQAVGYKFAGMIYGLIMLICVLLSLLFVHHQLTELLFAAFAIIVIVVFVIYSVRQEKIIRNRLLGLGLLFFFSMFFFIASLQVGSSINLFLMRDVDRVLWGWQIPTVVFGALDPLFVVLTAPFFVFLWRYLAKRNIEPHVGQKIIIGLLLGCVGIGVFALIGYLSLSAKQSNVVMLLVLFGYLCLGAGEMCLAPAMFNAASCYAPKHLASSLTGLMFLFIAFGGYAGSMLATLSDHAILVKGVTTRAMSIHIYINTFFIIAAMVFFAAMVMMIFSKKIYRLLSVEG